MTPRGRFSYATPEEPEKTEQQARPEVLAMRGKRDATGAAAPNLSPADGSRQALKNPAAYALPPQCKGRRGDEGGLRRTDVPREQLNVRIRPELKRAAAGLAGFQGMTLGDVVEAALIEYLKAAQDET